MSAQGYAILANSRAIFQSANYNFLSTGSNDISFRKIDSLSTLTKLKSLNQNFNCRILKKHTQMQTRLKMVAQTSGVPSGSDLNRPFSYYHPTIWGDHFLSYNSTDQILAADDITRHQNLKEQVRNMLVGGLKVSQTLEMIDAIQRLGVHYHFQTEIDQILEQVMDNTKVCLNDDDNDDDLYFISLKFRLLRQQGYNISCDVFDKFKDSKNKFNNSILNDVQGMLGLYEATHLRTHGEEILDQALVFTISHLQSMATQLSSPISDQINYALNQPYHMGIPRLEHRNYFSFYEANDSHNKVLLKFAKLDFNLLQKQHQMELGDITRWWIDLDFANKLPFARDRVVELYFWAMGMYFEPEYLLARRILIKVTIMLSFVDDIYDFFGTLEELELFTAAIERWNLSEMDRLPDYMKEVYKALINVYLEIEENMVKESKTYRLYYAKEAFKKLVRSNFVQSRWRLQKHIPSVEDYNNVITTSTGYPLMAIVSLVGMSDIVTKDTFDWLFSDPKIVIASSLAGRYVDHIVDYKVDKNRIHVASSVEVYMKQYNWTEEETMEELKNGIVNAWKDINGELMQLKNTVPRAVLMRLLNFDRVTYVVYKNEDSYTNSEGAYKDYVSSTLVHPIPM